MALRRSLHQLLLTSLADTTTLGAQSFLCFYYESSEMLRVHAHTHTHTHTLNNMA